MDTLAISTKHLMSSPQVVIALTGLITAIIVAIITSYLTYRYTRKTRLEAEWRIDKIKYYNKLLNSLTEIMSVTENSNQKDANIANKQFAHATNAVVLIAPQEVTDILFEFYRTNQEIFDKELTDEDEDELVLEQKNRLTKLVLAIRKDLQIKPNDNPDTFKFKLRSPLIEE